MPACSAESDASLTLLGAVWTLFLATLILVDEAASGARPPNPTPSPTVADGRSDQSGSWSAMPIRLRPPVFASYMAASAIRTRV